MSEASVSHQVFFLQGYKGQRFGVNAFLPEKKHTRGVIQLIPGMAEHAGRYSEFAHKMASNGFGVYVSDHPGSGITAGSIDKLGLLPANIGWEVMLENTRVLYTHIRKETPDVHIYILGHSMGSILARHFTAIYPVYVQGIILSGTFETPNLLLRLSIGLASFMKLVQGADKKSRWFNRFFYGKLNMPFRNSGPTRFEWISSVREEVDAYVSDPYCGYDCSWGFYAALFKGIQAMKKAQHVLKYRKTLALLTITGDKDPVGNFGKDAFRIYGHFYRQKFQHITMKVFKGRHELFHDESRDKVFDYLLLWMDEHLDTR